MSTAIAELPTGIAAPPATEEPLYEIVGSQRVELPPTGIYANLIAGKIYFAIKGFLRDHPHGTVVMQALLILDRENNLRRRPDVAFVAADRWPLERQVPETGDWDVVPTLAIEVLSPHDVSSEVEGKVLEYFAHGVQAVWIVHPEHRRVYCYSAANETTILDEQSTLTGGDVLPGLTIPLTNLFRRTTAAPQPQ